MVEVVITLFLGDGSSSKGVVGRLKAVYHAKHITNGRISQLHTSCYIVRL